MAMKNMLVVTWYVVKHHIESEVRTLGAAFPSPHFKYCQLNIYQLALTSIIYKNIVLTL